MVPGDSVSNLYRQQTTGYAFFGQLRANVTDSFRLTGGLRYSDDYKNGKIQNVDAPGNSTAFNNTFGNVSILGLARNDSKLTWQAGAQFDVMPDVMLYGTMGTGFKDGGFNSRATTAVGVNFNPENSMTYEIGVKSTLWEHRLVLNIDLYRMLVHGFQDSELNPITGIGFIVGNAGNRQTQGVEFELHATPLDELSVDASFSYNDAHFTQYLTGQCPGMAAAWNKPVVNVAPAGTCDFTGRTPFGNPKWIWSIGGQWQQPVKGTSFDWFVGGDVNYTGSQFLESTLDVRGFQTGYTLLNARLGLESEDNTWRVWLFGRNLTDTSYYTTAAGQGLAALISAGGTTAATGFMGFYAPLRVFGAEASYRF
jgi:iron complex outermembrane receptor protein